MKLGLKIWSTNDYYIKEAQELFRKGIFDYIELFAVPQSENFIKLWSSVEIPFILHAPHSLAGFNPAQSSKESKNFENLITLEEYRKALDPEYIIFHPGLDGTIKESIRQFRILKEKFPKIHKISLIENKPVKGLNGENCIGTTPKELDYLQKNTGMNLCLDIGHATCAANSIKANIWNFLRQFIELNPLIFHLSDGIINSEVDEHLNYGKGNFDLEKIISLLPEDPIISIETNKTPDKKLNTFINDAMLLRNLR